MVEQHLSDKWGQCFLSIQVLAGIAITAVIKVSTRVSQQKTAINQSGRRIIQFHCKVNHTKLPFQMDSEYILLAFQNQFDLVLVFCTTLAQSASSLAAKKHYKLKNFQTRQLLRNYPPTTGIITTAACLQMNNVVINLKKFDTTDYSKFPQLLTIPVCL